MQLVKWTPFTDLFEDFDSMMRPMRFSPAVDVYEEKDNIVVETPLAGIDPEKVNITVEDNVLRIEGQSEKKSEVDDKNYYRKEVRFGSFSRTIALPKTVNGDKAQASYDKGMLKIVIPKAEEAKPKSIKITMQAK